MNKKFAIDIQISDICQLHCDHCIMDLKHTKTDFESIKKTILSIKDKIGDQDIDIHFSGGEPLLCEYGHNDKYKSFNDRLLYDLIDFIKDNFESYTLYMTTNLLTYRYSYNIQFALIYIDHLSTSFDLGRFKTVKDLLTWVKNVKIVNKLLKDHFRPRLKVITTLTKRNMDSHDSVKRSIKLFKKLDVDFCFVPYMINKDSIEYKNNKDFYEKQYKSSLVYRNYLRNVYSCDIEYNLLDRDKTIDLILSNNFFACMYNSNTIYSIDNQGNEVKCIFNKECDSRYTHWQCKLIYPYDRFSTVLRDDCCKYILLKKLEGIGNDI